MREQDESSKGKTNKQTNKNTLKPTNGWKGTWIKARKFN